MLEVEKLRPEIGLQMAVVAVHQTRLFLQLLLEINEGTHVVFQVLAEHALHGTAIKADETREQFTGEQRNTTGLLLEDNLQQDAARQIFAGLGVGDLERLELDDQILDIPQRDIGARLGIVKAAVGIFLDQANWFGHPAILETGELVCSAPL